MFLGGFVIKRSKIIIELIKDEINVVQAMDILNLLLQDLTDKKIQSWLDNEINGYQEKDKIPEYRIVNCNIKGDYIVGRVKCTNKDIPIKSELAKEYSTVKVICSIYEISQYSLAEKESKDHCLMIPLHAVLANQISLINGEVISAYRKLSIYSHTNILPKIKSKVLKIFLELEKKYGNLDDYYIKFSNKEKEKEVIQNITNIITDNSIHIGNDNQIESSNVGVCNEI